MKNIITTLMIILFAISTNAIRVVGNGAGEAELKLQMQYENLPTWIHVCEQFPLKCFAKEEFQQTSVQAVLKKMKFGFATYKTIQFVVGKDIGKNIKADQLQINYEALYIDDKTPKSDLDIFKILIASMVFGSDKFLMAEDIPLVLQQSAIAHAQMPVAYLPGNNEDFIVYLDGQRDLQGEIMQTINDSFKIVSQTSKGYLVRTLGSNDLYEIIFENKYSQFEVIIFYRDNDFD